MGFDSKDFATYSDPTVAGLAPGYSSNARLQDGYNRGMAAAKAGSARPTPGSSGFENSNLSTAWFAGFDSLGRPSGGGGGGVSKPTSTSSGSNDYLPTLTGNTGAKTEPEPVAPTLGKLPPLNMRRGASVATQLKRMQSVDSVPMQQAKINAQEFGAASGAIHSSQQGGAAQRAVQNAMTPLAQAEANLIGSQDIANWQTKVSAIKETYEKEYAGYLTKLNISSAEKQAMLAANTTLSTALMGNITSLLNNPDIEFGEEVKNKLTSIMNSALKNNNVILDMGFSYA